MKLCLEHSKSLSEAMLSENGEDSTSLCSFTHCFSSFRGILYHLGDEGGEGEKEREGERERQRQKERDTETDRESERLGGMWGCARERTCTDRETLNQYGFQHAFSNMGNIMPRGVTV